MRIAIVGYGKMGKMIERIAVERGHEIGLKLDDQPPAAQTERDPPQLRDRFMRGMGVKKSKLPG